MSWKTLNQNRAKGGAWIKLNWFSFGVQKHRNAIRIQISTANTNYVYKGTNINVFGMCFLKKKTAKKEERQLLGDVSLDVIHDDNIFWNDFYLWT